MSTGRPSAVQPSDPGRGMFRRAPVFARRDAGEAWWRLGRRPPPRTNKTASVARRHLRTDVRFPC